MADDSSRVRHLVDLWKQAHALAEPQRKEFVRKTHEQDAELAANLAELLDQRDALPRRTTPVLSRIQELHGRGAESVVTLDTPDESGAKTTTEILRRLTQRGNTYERYLVEGSIGEGGQGAVLRAWDMDLRRKLAIKVMHRKGAGRTEEDREGDSRRLSRFLEEAQVTGQLEHPGVVPVHELGIDRDGRVYFTMQLVRGRDLRHVIDLVHAGKEDWTLTRALGVIIKVCETVAYAHSKGVLHRDLKPSNVMVGRFGEVYVMDWGLACVLGREDPRDARHEPDCDPQTQVDTERQDEKRGRPDSPLVTLPGAIIGTIPYMAIEQALGRKADRRSDVYSVGAMLYHLLAGHSPYIPSGARVSAHAVHAMVLNGPPASLAKLKPGTPVELVAICEKAMARDAEQRYTDTMEMAKDLEAYLGKRPISAVAPRLSYVLKLAFERNRTVALTAAAAAALVVVLVTVFITHLSDAVRETNAALNENRRLVDVLSAPALVREFDQLFPLLPEMAPRLRSWLERTDDVLSRRAAYELARGDEAGHLLADLDALGRLRPRAATNLERAENLRRDTIEAPADDWARAVASIREVEAYQGLELAPQLGLVPLGRNAHSGLWEFWHVLSGARPEVNPNLEEPVASEESGLVLVLIPGGSFAMGSPPGQTDQPNERLHRVALAPFFVSKYEVTQAQWVRVMGTNPAGAAAGTSPVGLYASGPEQEISLLHPVENVSWFDCEDFAHRIALELPTEAQWEYVCRAGTTTAFSWGDWPSSLEGNENILDLGFASQLGLLTSATWEDGFWHHAPVGSFTPNGFGVYDMHGNVSEWCRDIDLQDYPPDSDLPGDGLHTTGDERRRAFRGGSWYLPPEYCRSAFRSFTFPRGLNFTIGMRPVRRIERSGS